MNAPNQSNRCTCWNKPFSYEGIDTQGKPCPFHPIVRDGGKSTVAPELHPTDAVTLTSDYCGAAKSSTVVLNDILPATDIGELEKISYPHCDDPECKGRVFGLKELESLIQRREREAEDSYEKKLFALADKHWESSQIDDLADLTEKLKEDTNG